MRAEYLNGNGVFLNKNGEKKNVSAGKRESDRMVYIVSLAIKFTFCCDYLFPAISVMFNYMPMKKKKKLFWKIL